MKDFKKIHKIVENLPEDKREAAERLISKAEFMDEELEKLQKILLKKGWVEEYKNGENQYGLKKSSEGEVYNTLIKSYNATMRQVIDLIQSSGVDAKETNAVLSYIGATQRR